MYTVTRWHRPNWAKGTDSKPMTKQHALELAQSVELGESAIVWNGKPAEAKMLASYWRDSTGLNYLFY